MQPEMDLTGRALGRYRCIERIGQGGMGTVYKALDAHLDRFVAIKTLRRHAAISPDRKRRFIQEAKTASALNHPNIVHIYDLTEVDGIDIIVMEYVEGTPLDQLVEARLALADVLNYAMQMAGALATAHAAGVVHRDLKPSNVVITTQGVAKILDFGLAKLMNAGTDAESAGVVSPTEQITGTMEGIAFGTPMYMSPEQAQGLAVDHRSDIFSFGVMLYEM